MVVGKFLPIFLFEAGVGSLFVAVRASVACPIAGFLLHCCVFYHAVVFAVRLCPGIILLLDFILQAFSFGGSFLCWFPYPFPFSCVEGPPFPVQELFRLYRSPAAWACSSRCVCVGGAGVASGSCFVCPVIQDPFLEGGGGLDLAMRMRSIRTNSPCWTWFL